MAPRQSLPPSEETALRSFFSLAGEGARMPTQRIELTVGPPDVGGQRLLVRVEACGDPLDIPIFLDGSAHLRALGLPERLGVETVGPARVAVTLILSFLRPPEVDTSWIAGRLAVEVPFALERAALFESAARLSVYREHNRFQQERKQAADEARASLARVLPAALMALRQEGGSLSWTRGAPLHRSAAVSPSPELEATESSD